MIAKKDYIVTIKGKGLVAGQGSASSFSSYLINTEDKVFTRTIKNTTVEKAEEYTLKAVQKDKFRNYISFGVIGIQEI